MYGQQEEYIKFKLFCNVYEVNNDEYCDNYDKWDSLSFVDDQDEVCNLSNVYNKIQVLEDDNNYNEKIHFQTNCLDLKKYSHVPTFNLTTSHLLILNVNHDDDENNGTYVVLIDRVADKTSKKYFIPNKYYDLKLMNPTFVFDESQLCQLVQEVVLPTLKKYDVAHVNNNQLVGEKMQKSYLEKLRKKLISWSCIIKKTINFDDYNLNSSTSVLLNIANNFVYIFRVISHMAAFIMMIDNVKNKIRKLLFQKIQIKDYKNDLQMHDITKLNKHTNFFEKFKRMLLVLISNNDRNSFRISSNNYDFFKSFFIAIFDIWKQTWYVLVFLSLTYAISPHLMTLIILGMIFNFKTLINNLFYSVLNFVKHYCGLAYWKNKNQQSVTDTLLKKFSTYMRKHNTDNYSNTLSTHLCEESYNTNSYLELQANYGNNILNFRILPFGMLHHVKSKNICCISTNENEFLQSCIIPDYCLANLIFAKQFNF